MIFVPAAYSSQHCPQCGYTARDDRQGDRFECKHCGHKAQADQNGALNLLLRVNDPPTFMVQGTNDSIAPVEVVDWRMRAMKKLGTEVEYMRVEGMPHGFGLGTNTAAEGWVDRAASFFKHQVEKNRCKDCTKYMGKNEIALHDDVKPASATLTGFGFVQRKDLKSVPLTGYGSPSPFFSS